MYYLDADNCSHKSRYFMSRYYVSHAGMLQYLSQEFRCAARTEPDGGRFSTYASLLDRIADDLLYGDDEGAPEHIGEGAAKSG